MFRNRISRQRVLDGRSPRVFLPHTNDLMSKARFNHVDRCFVWLLKRLARPSCPQTDLFPAGQRRHNPLTLLPRPRNPTLELTSLRCFAKGHPFYQHVRTSRKRMFTEWTSRRSRMFGETLRRLGGWKNSQLTSERGACMLNSLGDNFN